MIARKLPFVEACKQSKAGDDSEARGRIKAELEQLFATNAWQIVLELMRDVVKEALGRLQDGVRPEFSAGEIAAIEVIRAKLRELSDPEDVDVYDEELTSE